ncbi:MAG: hypothetical protein K6G44_14320 [Lentisphaeria bacterium]|nr:hypothetical protein [Lentisphaeria bacterium]
MNIMLVDSFAFRANCRALAGAIVAWGASYRQLRSLSSLTGGYDCVALRVRVAAFGSDGVAETERRAGPPARRRDAFLLPAAELMADGQWLKAFAFWNFQCF